MPFSPRRFGQALQGLRDWPGRDASAVAFASVKEPSSIEPSGAGADALEKELRRLAILAERISGCDGQVISEFALSLGNRIFDEAMARSDTHIEGFLHGVKSAATFISSAVHQTRSFPTESFITGMVDEQPGIDNVGRETLQAAWQKNAGALIPRSWGTPLALTETLCVPHNVIGYEPCSLLEDAHLYLLPSRARGLDLTRRSLLEADGTRPVVYISTLSERETAALVAEAAHLRDRVYALCVDRIEAQHLLDSVSAASSERVSRHDAISSVVINDGGAFLVDVPNRPGSDRRDMALCVPFETSDQHWAEVEPLHRRQQCVLSHGYVTDGDLSRVLASVPPLIRQLPEIEKPGAWACFEEVKDRDWGRGKHYAPAQLVERILREVPDSLLSNAVEAERPVRDLPLSFDIGGAPPAKPPPQGNEPDQGPEEVGRVLDVMVASETGKLREPILAVGSRFILTALIRLATSAAVSARSVPVYPKPGAPVDLIVDAGGFRLVTPGRKSLDIPLDADSELATFILEMTDAHECWVTLSVYQNSKFLQKVTLKDADFLGTRDNRPLMSGSEVDLILHIRTEDQMVEGYSPDHRFNLSGYPFGALRPINQAIAKSLRQQLSDLHQSTADPEDIEDELRVIGSRLSELVPQSLIQILQESSPSAVWVQHCVDLDFPIELLLIEKDNENYFLGDRVPICRWYLGVKAAACSEHKSISRAAVLVGDTPFGDSDYQMVLQRCEAVQFLSPSDVYSNIFGKSEYSLLHFIGHFEVGDEFSPSLKLKNGRLPMQRVGRLPKEREFEKTAPVVVLNGCGTNVPYDGFWGKDSFTHRFVLSNASVVLGTLWPVHDSVAHEFSSKFYGKLAEGIPLGTALCETKHEVATAKSIDDQELSPREQIRRRISARSYSVFGHPNFNLEFAAPTA